MPVIVSSFRISTRDQITNEHPFWGFVVPCSLVFRGVSVCYYDSRHMHHLLYSSSTCRTVRIFFRILPHCPSRWNVFHSTDILESGLYFAWTLSYYLVTSRVSCFDAKINPIALISGSAMSSLILNDLCVPL